MAEFLDPIFPPQTSWNLGASHLALAGVAFEADQLAEPSPLRLRELRKEGHIADKGQDGILGHGKKNWDVHL